MSRTRLGTASTLNDPVVAPPRMILTPSSLIPSETFGLFTLSGQAYVPPLTGITFTDTNNREGYVVFDQADLTTISFPSLTTLWPGSQLHITECGNLISLTCPVLVTGPSQIIIGDNIAMTTCALPLLAAASNMEVSNNTSLVTFSLPSLTAYDGDLDLHNNALDQTSVDGILAQLVSIAAWGAGGQQLILAGGTNSTPSAGGLADKATLVGRGATVTNN